MSETTAVALNAEIPSSTTWGDVHFGLGEMDEGEAMAAWVEDLGPLGGDITITTEKGEKLELKDNYGTLYDLLQKESSLTIEVPLMKPSEKTRGILWDVTKEGTGTAAKLKVYSLVNNKKLSAAIWCPKIPTSESVEFPKCTAILDFEYSTAKGCSGKVSINVMRPVRSGAAKTELFQFGVASSILTEDPSDN